MNDNRTLWSLTAGVAAVVAAAATRQLLQEGWRALRGTPPPERPDDPDIPWADALLWAAATGAAAGVSRLLARRGAVGGWRRLIGRRPPAED